MRSRQASKPRDLYHELYHLFKMWQAPWQQCCQGACQISKQCNHLNYQSPSLHEILWSLHWRHNDHDGVSNHQPHGCLLNRLFRRRSKKTSKLRVTGLCVGNSPGLVNSPHKGPVTRKMFPFDDVIMIRCLIRYWNGTLDLHWLLLIRCQTITQPMQNVCQLDLNKIQWYLNWNANISFKKYLWMKLKTFVFQHNVLNLGMFFRIHTHSNGIAFVSALVWCWIEFI